jgi:hypothetical protein
MNLEQDGYRWRLALTDGALLGRENGLALEVLTGGIDPSIAPMVLVVSGSAPSRARVAVFLEADEALLAGLVLVVTAVERMGSDQRHESRGMVQLAVEAVRAASSPAVAEAARLLLEHDATPTTVADWAAVRAGDMLHELRAMVRGGAA